LKVREDDVAGLIRDLETKGLSSATIAGILVALGGVLNAAVRDGFLPSNPIRKLAPDERPEVKSKGKRPLDSAEIEALLAAASPTYSTLLATAIFTGLRCGEILGLKWSDLDVADGFVRVERQYGRDRSYAELKTNAGLRSVVLAPSLSKLLAEHRRASRFSGADDPVFASRAGTPLSHRNVTRRGMEAAVKRAGLDEVPGKRTPSMHDCRDTFASILIARGEDVVYVSRQLGHARPSMTLDVYADLFDRHAHAERARASMESLAGGLLAASLERSARTRSPYSVRRGSTVRVCQRALS